MGKLVVFEGIDGSGKSTQFQKLCEYTEAKGRDFRRLVFPQYSEPSSAPLRMYLSGELGSKPDDVNAYAASVLFTVDRFASFKKSWQGYYERGGLLLADRYTTSNAVHQGSKFKREDRKAFFKWLSDFEYGLIELPAPDTVIYLDLPAEFAVEQLRKREAQLQAVGDIHERNTDYLMKCSETANEAADFYGWVRVKCLQDGALRSVEDIHEEVISRLGGLI